MYNCGLTVRNKRICYVMLCYPSKTPFTRFTTGCTCWMNRGDWKCETWICGTSLHGWKILDMKIRYHIARVENTGKVSMESQSVKKCLKVVVFVCIVTPFSVSLLDRWMRNGTILDNRTRLLMKLLTTSSADIVQECCVMFDVKSVSKTRSRFLSAGVTFCLLLLILRWQIYAE